HSAAPRSRPSGRGTPGSTAVSSTVSRIINGRARCSASLHALRFALEPPCAGGPGIERQELGALRQCHVGLAEIEGELREGEAPFEVVRVERAQLAQELE